MNQQTLEIPVVLNMLGDRIEVLHQKLKTLDERLQQVYVGKDIKVNPDQVDVPGFNTSMAQKIDHSVCGVTKAIRHLDSIIDGLQI